MHAPPGVAVEPSALGFRVAVPTFWAKHGDTVLASAGGLAVLLLAALVLWIRVRGPALEGYLAVSVEGVEVVGEELEPRGARSVTLGTGKGADLPFAMPADEPFSAALHTSKRSLFDREPRVRLDVLRGLDPAATIRCGRGPWEPFDGSAEVFDETHVRNGPVTISYTNLSLPVPGDEEDESPVAAGPRPGHAGDLL